MNNYVNYYDYLNTFNRSNGDTFKNISNDEKLYLSFIRGNMFDGLYSSYMNYKPYEINPSNERDYLLFLVQMYGFAMHDLGLYLDVYPNDKDAINLRTGYTRLYNQALVNYEGKYGSSSLNSSNLSTIPWNWDSKYWPWEVYK